MRAVVVSDLHVGVHKDQEPWLSQSVDLFRSIHDTCIRESIDTIIIPGDFFHERKLLNVQTICRAMEMLANLSPLRVILLLGNHDMYYKNLSYPYSPFVFGAYPNVQIIDEPTIIDNITFLPWSTKPYKLTEYNTPILIGHFEIDGFPATCTDMFQGGYTSKDFSHFDLVISGHFHIPCRRGNILYCGSPFQLTFSDRGSKCGYYILDNTNITLIENPTYAKYLRITTNDSVTKEQVEGNIVELSFMKDYGSLGNIRRMEYIQSLNPLRLSTNFTNISICDTITQSESIQNVSKSNKEILKEYIDTISVPKHIKKSALHNIVDRLLKEIGGVT